MIRGAGCELSLKADGAIVGNWDRLRLEQVLTNLLANACKYGKGHPVEVWVEEVNGGARFGVIDHGIGIALEDQRRIFERFERAVAPRHYSGFGLGLWIARQVVDAHGGKIELTSAVGGGSRFIVELPIGQS
jgi:signal transduction histidine kinase